ncbi:hypothetical protein BJ508DRAFT_410246 [Ascobolus immersus RN42]|uniref:Hypervirulence associated protein TUDOR domain-containing protein n=1 Tax=Ascobolus immersus RN42 TaxID=1160509 RepID=A0A3N4IPX3_ASCIM|nr:hypothetical protein BJ508DRAFT_410246 [Ascobolus immersus RN42]
MPVSGNEVHDKHGNPIHEGDNVYTPFRGGRHEGKVSEIVTTKEEAEEAGVKNPPNVLFTDQNGTDVAHKPGTLDVRNEEKDKQ